MLLMAGIYFTLLYDFQVLRFLLCCVVVIPIASLLLLLPKAFLCRVDMEIKQSVVTRGEPLKLAVIAGNKGFLPTARIFVTLRYRGQGEKEVVEKEWLYGVGRGSKKLSLELSAAHCGEARFAIKRAGVCDYLGLFSLPVRKGKTIRLCVTPVITPVSQKEMEKSGLRAKLFAAEQDGDTALRDYQPGDSIHRVYWKLSVKTEALQVRAYEQTGSMRLFLNYSDGFCDQALKWDRYLDTACSLLCFLIGESGATRMVPEIVWQQQGIFYRHEMRSMEALYAWAYAILMREDMGQLLAEEEIPFLKGSCRLDEDCKLYIGEQCVYEEIGMGI